MPSLEYHPIDDIVIDLAKGILNQPISTTINNITSIDGEIIFNTVFYVGIHMVWVMIIYAVMISAVSFFIDFLRGVDSSAREGAGCDLSGPDNDPEPKSKSKETWDEEYRRLRLEQEQYMANDYNVRYSSQYNPDRWK